MGLWVRLQEGILHTTMSHTLRHLKEDVVAERAKRPPSSVWDPVGTSHRVVGVRGCLDDVIHFHAEVSLQNVAEVLVVEFLGDPVGQEQVVDWTSRKDFPPMALKLSCNFDRGGGHRAIAAFECSNCTTEPWLELLEPSVDPGTAVAL